MSVDSPVLTLGAVFIANRPQLFRIAQKILRAPDWAEEVLQDAYLKLVEGACAREVHKPLCYCCQVVRNLALDYYRRHAMEATYRHFGEDVELLQLSGGSIPEQVLCERQALDEIDRVLDTLPARTRLAFELYRISGMTQRDIGQRLGCSATLVNFMIRDAVNALQTCAHLLE